MQCSLTGQHTHFVAILAEEIFLVENGQVENLVARPDRAVAELVYIFDDVEEFPLIWCIRSDRYQVMD